MMNKPYDWDALWSPIRLSLQVTVLASIVVIVLGIAIAYWMSKSKLRGKVIIETLFMLPLVLPPTVVGFLLLVLLGRRSWIGRFIEWLFDAPVIFSWWAAVIAAVIVSFPLVYQTMKAGFDSVDRSLQDSARSSGASEWQVLRYISLPLASRSIRTAYILGFARALGEFGATLMIAGNIPGRTQTVPTAIYVAVDSGDSTTAWILTGTTVFISFLLLLFARK
ncbi:molybdate ABC transporter permease subunit [Paenibacillus sp. MMS18-CY102]|uniref:molybdate ABC transporter permease subunit n=1 Tax=Paenibacillus sp. MMS18-CY102 TaxID=2682849 RepID=UPI001365BD49|nr:molybdate ABC transporter permease subunit [Paenibacillus sp. MMS18-CY102]MWC26961.1 molybdate ABC transporter permease subunit [Paenibacillus sp. MMS18-CY102]